MSKENKEPIPMFTKEEDIDKFLDDNKELMDDLAMQEEYANQVEAYINRIKELEERLDEECRLNGMGGCRELKLMTRVKELEKECERLKAFSYERVEECKGLLQGLALAEQVVMTLKDSIEAKGYMSETPAVMRAIAAYDTKTQK